MPKIDSLIRCDNPACEGRLMRYEGFVPLPIYKRKGPMTDEKEIMADVHACPLCHRIEFYHKKEL